MIELIAIRNGQVDEQALLFVTLLLTALITVALHYALYRTQPKRKVLMLPFLVFPCVVPVAFSVVGFTHNAPAMGWVLVFVSLLMTMWTIAYAVRLVHEQEGNI